MSYQTGRMGMAEGIALVFFSTVNRVFLTAPVRIMDESASLAWLSTFLGGIIMVGVLWLMIRLFKQYPGDLLDVTECLLGRIGAWVIGLYYISVFFIHAVLLLRQFAENTLLTALPDIDFSLIILAYGFVAAILVYFELEAICRASYVILPFCVTALVSVLVLLVPFYNIYFLAPWQGNGIGPAVITSLTVTAYNFEAVSLLIIAPVFQNLRTIKNAAIIGLGLSAAVKTFSILVFCMVFGVSVGQEKVLPFFEMARLVYLSRYLQRIEALFIMLWVVAGVLGIAVDVYMGLYLLTRLLRLPSMRPILPIVMIVLVELGMMPPDIVTVIELENLVISTYFKIGLYVIPVILLITAWFKNRKKRKVRVCAKG